MVLKVEDLRKNFNSRYVLNGLDLQVERGEIFALVGPNGAGKTTTLRCIYGDLKPDAGVVEVFGEKFKTSFKKKIAVVNEDRAAFKRFTGTDYVKLWSLLYPTWDQKLFSRFVLHYNFDLKQQVDTYSIGMKSAFYVSLAVASKAELLLLDEPTQHLDPVVRSEMLKVVEKLGEQGRTVVISSHEIYELEEIATSFAVIKEGKIVYRDTVDDAKAKHRLVANGQSLPRAEIIGVVGNETLVKTDEDVGRYPTFKDIVIGYLKREDFSPFE